MPFRSEKLVVLEKIRRAREEASELLERQNEIRGQLAARGRQRAAWLLLFAGVLGACGIGWFAGIVAADARAMQLRKELESGKASELAREHAQITECQAASDRDTSELLACRRGLADRARALAIKPSPSETCTCAEGDPLCSCTLDRGAVATALAAAQSPVRLCFVPAKSESFHARITFAPRSGQVERAVIDSSDGNLTETDRTCVLAVLQRITIPPFGGASVTVGKQFTVRAP